jgi:hypothetical protein
MSLPLCFSAINQKRETTILQDHQEIAKPHRRHRTAPRAADDLGQRQGQRTAPPFPETPEGQRQWLEAVNEAVMSTPHGRGKGVFWWEPAASGELVNRGYFDAGHNALPIIQAFDKYARPAHRVDGQHPPAMPPSALKFGPAP